MTVNNNINSLYLFQSNEIDSIQGKSNVYIWNGYQDKENYISIPKYLDDNAEKFRKKYIEFLHDLGTKNISNKNLAQHLKINNNYNLWWMSLLIEKSHYKSVRIKDCLKLFALEEILIKNKPSEITLYFSDKVIINTIRKLSETLEIKFILKKIYPQKNYKYKSRSIFHSIYFKSPYILQALIYLLQHVFIYWPLRKTYKIKWFTEKKSIFFFSYLFHLDYIKYKEDKYKTGQWGPITDLLKELSLKSNWMHHFVPNPIIPNTKTGKEFIDKLNIDPNTNGAHQFLLNYLNLKIVLKVISSYIKIVFKLPIFIKFKDSFKPNKSNACFWYLLKKDFMNSIIGPKSIENLLWIELFDLALSKIPYQEKGIYLQENQGWEKAFITSWKNHNHGKLIGLNNGFVRFWDTRFFDDSRTVKDPSNDSLPIPDHTILTDHLSWNSYLESGYPANKLLKAETIRYFDTYIDLSKKKQDVMNQNNREFKTDNKFKVLILGDIVFDTTSNMIKTIENLSNKENFLWTLKAHPGCPINIKNYKKIKLETYDKNLKDVISKFDVAIVPAATLSALEAYLYGINVIIFLSKEELNLSPLRKFSEIKVVYDLNTMNQAFNPENIKNYTPKKRDLFWFDKNLPLWKKVLS